MSNKKLIFVKGFRLVVSGACGGVIIDTKNKDMFKELNVLNVLVKISNKWGFDLWLPSSGVFTRGKWGVIIGQTFDSLGFIAHVE